MTEEASREEKCPTCKYTVRHAIRCAICGHDYFYHDGSAKHEYVACTDPWHKGSATAPAVETPKEKTMANENEVNDLGYPLWPVDSSGRLVLNISILINDATKADRGVMEDPILAAITNALKPLFSQLPCVDFM